MDDFSNKIPVNIVFFFCVSFVKHKKNHHPPRPPPTLGVDVEFLVHLRLPVADGPGKRNSNCLQVVLPFDFSVSDSQV